jgi:hypothetical protein
MTVMFVDDEIGSGTVATVGWVRRRYSGHNLFFKMHKTIKIGKQPGENYAILPSNV